MANDTDITFTIGFDVDKAKQKEAFNKISYSFMNSPLAKLSRSERKELNSFQSRHSEELANQTLKRFLNTPERGIGLFAKANKYRNEHDAMSKLMGVGSLPTAPAHEQYLALKQFKENNAKEQKAFEAKLSALASSLDNSIGSSADNKIKDMMKERGINEGLLAKSERLKTASSLDDFVAPLADNRIDNAIKTKEGEMSKLASSLDETIGKSFEERINSIQTPSGTDTKEKKSPKEPQKVVTQEQKAQNRELTDSIFKLSKILALWHLIKKAINNIAKDIKFVNNESQAITSRDIQEKGIFSIDAYSAMRANTDKTGAMIGRGLAFMGASAPFSMTSFNDTVKSLQELRNKAMSGQGIQDEQQIISLQRISDSLGLGYNVASLMSNPNIDLTDFVKDLMRSVEKFLPKLDTLDDIKKSLLTSDFIKALGPELIDAISYNYNLNQRTGETASVIEKVLAAGAGAHTPIDFTVEANNLKTTMTTLNGKFDLLKQALENLFAGPLADFINNRVVPKVDDVSDAAIRYKLRQSSSPYIQAIGWAKAEASLTTQNRKAYEADEKQQLNWLKENRVKFSDEMNSLYNKVATGGTLTQNEALQALLMPYAQSSNFGSTIESLSAAAIGQSLLKRFGGRTPKDVLKNGKISVDEKTFLGVMDKNIPITQATVSAATGNYTFLEGGLGDWDPQKYGTNYENYLRTAINALGYDYNSVLASILTDSDFVNNSKAFKQVSWTNDANNDKIIDSYITIKLVDTYNHTSYVRTKITDDMKQTFAAELHY